jgi:hypothetical protein
MSNATAQSTHAVRSGIIDDRRICTLSACDAELQVSFAPELGMLACSMLHAGEELLGQRSGLAAYACSGATMGIPLLYPWAKPARRVPLPLRRTDRGDRRWHAAR